MGIDDLPLPAPGPGQARVRLEFAGVNFIDVYHRSGAYPLPTPFVPGSEGAGVVDAVGAGVAEPRVGDRVAWAMQPGSYAECAVFDARPLVPVPDEIALDVAAAAMLQGMTAHYLTCSTFPLRPAHVALVHAAAGGAGQLITQMAKRRGATVIGTVSTEEKAALARAAGADEVVIYTRQSFRETARRANGGRGVDVVYDSVGRTTFEEGLDALRPRGMMVLFGQSSGPVPPVDPTILNKKGSLFLTRPSLAHHMADRAELQIGRAHV